MGLPIYSETRDLCDMTTCPIKQGDLTIAYQQYLPPIIPAVSPLLLCAHTALQALTPRFSQPHSLRMSR